jgi:hypothetical protein
VQKLRHGGYQPESSVEDSGLSALLAPPTLSNHTRGPISMTNPNDS